MENIRLTKSVTIIDAPNGRKIVAIEGAGRIEIPLINNGNALTNFEIVGLPKNAHPSELSPSTDFPMLPSAVVALRNEADLVLKYDEGMEVIVKGFFAKSSSETIVVSLPAQDAPLLEISNDMGGKVISVNQELLVMRGQTPTLLALSKGDLTLRYAMAEILEASETSTTSTFWGAGVRDSSFGMSGMGPSTSIILGTVAGFGAVYALEKGKASTATSISITSTPEAGADGYKVGDVIQFTVNSPQDATVAAGTGVGAGLPSLKFMVGEAGERKATYRTDGSDKNKLIFEYTVIKGDWDANGISMKANSFELNGGTINNADGNAIDLNNLAFSNDAKHKVTAEAETFNATTGKDELAGVDGRRDSFKWQTSGDRGGDDTIEKFNFDDGDYIDLSGFVSGFTKGTSNADDWIDYTKPTAGATAELTIDLDGPGAKSLEQKIELREDNVDDLPADAAAWVSNGYILLA